MPAGPYAVDLDSGRVEQDATYDSGWVSALGCTDFVNHIHVDAVGAAPSATVVVEGANQLNNDGTAVTPKVIDTATVTATGDTYKEISTKPYKYVRLRVSANTDVQLRAVCTGVRRGA